MNELISVIIPVYNEEKYIEKCLLSVINQTYKNIEILIINDGSTDKSVSICEKYIKDKRIKIYNKTNGGLSSARNYGLDKAKGEYIYFIDSNDFIELDTLECMYNTLKKENCDIVIGNYYQYKNNKDVLKIKYNDFIVNEDKYDNLYNEHLTLTVMACNKLYNKKIFDNLRFKEGIVHEDEYIITDILAKANSVYYLSKPLYHYRYISSSISNNVTKQSLDNLILAYEKRCLFFKKNKELLLKTKMHEFYIISNNSIKINITDKYLNKLKHLSKEILLYDISFFNRFRYNFAYRFTNTYLCILKLYKRL